MIKLGPVLIHDLCQVMLTEQGLKQLGLKGKSMPQSGILVEPLYNLMSIFGDCGHRWALPHFVNNKILVLGKGETTIYANVNFNIRSILSAEVFQYGYGALHPSSSPEEGWSETYTSFIRRDGKHTLKLWQVSMIYGVPELLSHHLLTNDIITFC